MPKKKNSKSTDKNIDETKVYKSKKGKTNKKRKIPTKKIIIIALLILLILAGIGFGILWGVVREAKLDVQDLALKYENSVVVDKERKCYCRT